MLDGRCERLEVRVPDPRDVAAVGIAVVQRRQQTWPTASFEKSADRSVETRGVLYEDQTQLAAIDRHLFEATEGRPEVRDRECGGRKRDVERARHGKRGQCVVGVVQAG